MPGGVWHHAEGHLLLYHCRLSNILANAVWAIVHDNCQLSNIFANAVWAMIPNQCRPSSILVSAVCAIVTYVALGICETTWYKEYMC